MTNRANLKKLVRIPLINLSSHGGVRILVELANTFVRNGWVVEIIIPPGRNSSVYSLDPRVLVRPFGIATGFKLLDYAVFLLLLPIRLQKGITVANFFVTYFPCLIGSYFGRGKLLYFVQDLESKYSGVVGGLLNAICDASYRSSRIVAANDYLKATLEKKGFRIYETIRIGPSEPFFIEPRTQEQPFDLMYMPRHEAWKRIDRFEEICASLPEIPPSRILCVGQDEAILKRLAQQGFATCKPKNDQQLIDCFDQAKIFLLTSDREGFGLPPLEAMARGRPVVSFRCGGPDLYINDGVNSYLVDNSKQAQQRIRNLLESSSERKRMAEAARETAHRFRLAEEMTRFVAFADRELHAEDL